MNAHTFYRGALVAGLTFGLAMQPDHLSEEPTPIYASSEAFGDLPPDILADLPAVVAIEDPKEKPFHGGDGVGTGITLKLGKNALGVLTAGHVVDDENAGKFLGVTGQGTDGTLGACRSDTLVAGSRDAAGYHEAPVVASSGIAPIEGAGGVILSSIFSPDRALIETQHAVSPSAVSLSQLGSTAFVGEHVVFANYQTMEPAPGQFLERGPQYTDSRNKLALYGGVIVKIVGYKAVVVTNLGIRYTDQNPGDIEGSGLSAGGSGGPVFAMPGNGDPVKMLGMSDATNSEAHTPQQIDETYDVNLLGVPNGAQNLQVTYIDMVNPGIVAGMQQDLQDCQ